MNQTKLDPLIEGYLDYLREVQRKAHRTIVDIRCTLKRVSERMNRVNPGTALWKTSLHDCLQWIEIEREAGLSTSSISKDISHLRGLLNYAWKSGRAQCNVLDGFNLQDDGKRKISRVLSVDEARRLIEACPRRNKLQRRERTVILLLYGCGLRTGELCRLNVQDVDLDRQEIFVQQGKGDRQRRIPVPDAVWSELLAYLSDRRGKRFALFRTEAQGKRINDRIVSSIVQTAAKHAGIEGKIYPKTLRHSFATHLADRGVDLAVIASLMGHRSIREMASPPNPPSRTLMMERFMPLHMM